MRARSEVSDAALVMIEPLARENGGLIPGNSPFHCVIGRVNDGAMFDVRNGTDLALIGFVAWTPIGATKLWAQIESVFRSHAEGGTGIEAGFPFSEGAIQIPPRPATVPWLAVLYLQEGLYDEWRPNLPFICDFELCLALSLIPKNFNPPAP